MVIRGIQRELRYVDYDDYFPVDERYKLRSGGDYSLREVQIPEYMVHLIVAISNYNQRLRESHLSAIPLQS